MPVLPILKISLGEPVYLKYNALMKTVGRIIKNYGAELYFLVLALLIFLPLFGNGYILALDMTFTPNMNFPLLNGQGLYSETVRDFTLFFLAKVISSQVLQKLLLTGIFFLNGYLMYRFLAIKKGSNKLAALAIATFFVWNPFTYTRLLAGQWAFLLGNAFIPLFVHLSTLYFASKRLSNKYLLLASIIWFVAGLISIHHLGLLFVFFFCQVFVLLMSSADKWNNIVSRALVLILFMVLLLSTWVLPSLLAGNPERLSENNLLFFAPTPDLNYGLTINLISLHGFWAEQNLGLMPKQINSLWLLLTFIFILIASLPFIKIIIKKIKQLKLNSGERTQALFFLTVLFTGLSGLILAHGATGAMYEFYDLFHNNLPLLQPFRDTQKFLALYLFALCLFMFQGLSLLMKSLGKLTLERQKITNLMLCILFITASLMNTPTLAFAASGQLKLTQYPESWYKLQGIIESRPTSTRLLILPWHAYNIFPFLRAQIADPAPSFFSAYVVREQVPAVLRNHVVCDLEFKGTHKNEQLNLCLNYNMNDQEWIRQIKANGIDYILLHKTRNREPFRFLADKEHFQLLFSDFAAEVYKVQ